MAVNSVSRTDCPLSRAHWAKDCAMTPRRQDVFNLQKLISINPLYKFSQLVSGRAKVRSQKRKGIRVLS